MKLDKKITLRHFVNLNLHKKGESLDQGYYPLYLEIIYRRQHLQIKSIIDKVFIENMQNVDEQDRMVMNLELERVKKILRYEERLLGDNHRLKGIGNRYTNFNAAVFDIVEDGLRVKLKKIIVKLWPEQSIILNYDKRIVPIEKLYAVTKILWPELGNYLNLNYFEMELKIWQKYFMQFPRKEVGKFKYPAFIDWMAEEHFAKMIELTVKEKKLQEKVVKQILKEVDQIIKLSTVGL